MPISSSIIENICLPPPHMLDANVTFCTCIAIHLALCFRHFETIGNHLQ